jgi:hypothetical protein
LNLFRKLYLRKIEIMRWGFRVWKNRSGMKESVNFERNSFFLNYMNKMDKKVYSISNHDSVTIKSRAFYVKFVQFLDSRMKSLYCDFIIRLTAFGNFKIAKKNVLLFRKIMITKKLKWFIYKKNNNDLKYYFNKLQIRDIKTKIITSTPNTSILYILDKLFWKNIYSSFLTIANYRNNLPTKLIKQPRCISLEGFSLLHKAKKLHIILCNSINIERKQKIESELYLTNPIEYNIKPIPKPKPNLSISRNDSLSIRSYPLLLLQRIISKPTKTDFKKFLQNWKLKAKILKQYEILETYNSIEEDFTSKLRDIETSYENTITMIGTKNNDLQSELIKIKQSYQLQSKLLVDLQEKFQNYEKFLE